MAVGGRDGRRGRFGLVAVAAAAVFVTGMAAHAAVANGGPRPSGGGESAVAAPTEDAPRPAAGGIRLGFPRTRDGAREAALTFAATVPQQLMYATPEQVVDIVTATSADGATEASPAEVSASVTEAQAALVGGYGNAWWIVTPLAVRVDAYDGERAQVSVWVVRVLSRAAVASPQTSWAVTTLELVWERGDWRVWSSDDSPGPSPEPDGSDPSATAAELDQRLDGFELVKDHG
jgi:hypothetical protein